MSDFERNESAGEPRVERFYSARASTPPPIRRSDAESDIYTPNEEYADPSRYEDYYEPNEPDGEQELRYDGGYYPPYDEEPEYEEPDYEPRYEPDYASDYERDYADEYTREPRQGSMPREPEPYRPPAPPPAPDYSAYYRGGTANVDLPTEPAYAPPKRLDLRGTIYLSMMNERDEATAAEPAPPQPQAANVYKPREATWAATERRNVLSVSDAGYSVRDEEPPRVQSRKRRHTARNIVIVASVVAVLGAAGYLMRDKLAELLGGSAGNKNAPTPEYIAVTTPAPIRSYDEAPKLELSSLVSREIDAVSGAVSMDKRAVTEQNVLTSSLREDGLYDFYLFSSSDGRLLCYFDGLKKNDMAPVGDGCFYVKQAPYLIKSDGSALVRLDSLEASLGKRLAPSAPLNGWFILSDEHNASFNYMSMEGELLSTLWFSRAYPFTGGKTVAYVDTGVSGAEDRYILYVLSADGTMIKWRETPDMNAAAVSACSAVYMDTGELYSLDDIAEPIAVSDKVVFYPDCGAIVARSPESGKYGLFVGGDKHYDFIYDSIEPVAGDIEWARRSFPAAAGEAQVRTVEGADYPQPLSYYFELQKDGGAEYVALSSVGVTPIFADDLPR